MVVANGEGQAHTGDMVAGFSAPAAFLIGPSMPHGFVSEGPINGWIIQFDTTVFQPSGAMLEFDDVSNLFVESERGITFGKPAAEKAATILHSMDALGGMEKWMEVLRTLAFLSTDTERVLCSRRQNEEDMHKDKFDIVVSAAFNDIGKNYLLSEVSKSAGMSISKFCRIFKKRYGLSFTEYLHSIRINNAKKLLIQTKFYIDDICYESGFNNVSFFNRKFKQLTGMTPRKYRDIFSSDTTLPLPSE